MFTGIVETVGEVLEIEPHGELTTLTVRAPAITDGLKQGDSIAVNGACLTVTRFDDRAVSFDAVRETVEKTNLGDLRSGHGVNLERALAAGGRLDGHIVQGHVDGTGRVDRLERDGDDVRLYVTCDAGFADLLVDKGSVCIDGVSLTVVGVEKAGFDVALIPHTLEVTTLGRRRPGERVNLEADILGKYLKRYLERIGIARGPAGE
ncbi:MAG: riboflavin synthase [Myxococcota bacterium]